MRRRFLPLLALLVLPACSGLESPPADDHVVPAPISARANVVLRNLVTEYGTRDGRWGAEMSPGCAAIWGTQFGYRAGVRRKREDVTAIAEATASRVAADVRGLALDAVFGEVDRRDPAVYGFPALLVSSTLGGRSMDGLLFSMGISRIGDLDGPDAFDARESAGLATLYAELARCEPDLAAEHLERARELAAGAAGRGGGVWEGMALAAIARASGEPADVERARAAIEATAYRFEPGTGAFLPPAGREVLSIHLEMVHALADLAVVAGDADARTRAASLLDYVFSDAYFDGRFLVHHLEADGRPSPKVCSGCNFLALYLVDRLHGDSFVIDPVPPLPERAAGEEPEAPREPEWDVTLVLPAAAPRATHVLDGRPPAGRLLFETEGGSERIGFVYRSVGIADQSPNGVVVAQVALWFLPGSSESRASFDDEGRARFEEGLPGVFAVTITLTRRPDGRLDGRFVLSKE